MSIYLHGSGWEVDDPDEYIERHRRAAMRAMERASHHSLLAEQLRAEGDIEGSREHDDVAHSFQDEATDELLRVRERELRAERDRERLRQRRVRPPATLR